MVVALLGPDHPFQSQLEKRETYLRLASVLWTEVPIA